MQGTAGRALRAEAPLGATPGATGGATQGPAAGSTEPKPAYTGLDDNVRRWIARALCYLLEQAECPWAEDAKQAQPTQQPQQPPKQPPAQ